MPHVCRLKRVCKSKHKLLVKWNTCLKMASLSLQSQLTRTAVLCFELTFLQLSFTEPSVYLPAPCSHEVPVWHSHFKHCSVPALHTFLEDLISVQTWGILVKTFSKGTALCSVLVARSWEGNSWILHHCKRSQGPLTKRLPVGSGLAPNGTDGLWGRSPLHSHVLWTVLMFLSQGTMNSSQDSWWIFMALPALLPEHVQPPQLLRELLTASFPPAVTVHTLKLFWAFLDVFAPSLFSRSCPDWRSETLQHVSIWEQPTISPSVTTALSNIFFSLLMLLMPLQSLPSGILQMAQHCSAVLGHLHLWSIKKSPPSQIFLAQYDGTMRVKKNPKAYYNASMVTKISGIGENAIEIVFCFTVWMMLFQLPFPSTRYIIQTKICKDAYRF